MLIINLSVPELAHGNWWFNSSCLLSSLPPKDIIIALSHIGSYTKRGLLEAVCIVKTLSHSAVQDKDYISAPLRLMAKIWHITGCSKNVPGSLNQMNEGEGDDAATSTTNCCPTLRNRICCKCCFPIASSPNTWLFSDIDTWAGLQKKLKDLGSDKLCLGKRRHFRPISVNFRQYPKQRNFRQNSINAHFTSIFMKIVFHISDKISLK